VKYWVGITDDDWFIHQSKSKPDEVNLWQSGPKPPRSMDPGTLFLFKLHAPNNFIVGGGYLVRFTVLPCFLAWEAFGENNGVTSLEELIQRISQHRHSQQNRYCEIGCNILIEPFFFAEEDWIPIPSNWSPNIQRGLTYDTNEEHGSALWASIQERIARNSAVDLNREDRGIERYGDEYLSHARLGQGAFRILVTDAYHRRCAVTNEKTLPALEAAHIKPYSKDGPHRTNNGLLLRADIHRLFHDGYVTLDPGLRFIVSESARQQFDNGSDYYRYHGARLQNLPNAISEQPSGEFIKWHNEHCFLG
jgi:HNH endonuclease